MILDTGEATVVKLEGAASSGGNRTFGGATVIAWEPSSTDVAVSVTVIFQGTTIAVQTLDPTNLTMQYNGMSGDDFTKGKLKAKFSGAGSSGQIDTVDKISWSVSGGEGTYQGFVGSWVVS